MNEFKALYDSVGNPLDIKQTWDNIVDIYSKSLSFSDFYNRLSNISSKNNAEIDHQDRENFYLYVWNLWKKSILDAEDKTLAIIDIKELKDALNKDTVETFTDLQAILGNNVVSRYFMRVLSSDKSEYTTINSYQPKDKNFLQYMISLNIDAKYIYKMASLVISACNEENLPYYIRLTEKNDCDDTFNLYTDKDNIYRYISLLNRVRKENSLLTSELNPPLLMGNIKNLFGICSSSVNDKESYNSNRTRILLNALDGVMCNYLLKNMERVISYKGTKIPVKRFLCMFTADTEVEMLIATNEENITRYYANNWEEINNLKDYIQERLMLVVDKILGRDLREYTDNEIIKIEIPGEKTMDIYLSTFLVAIRRLTPVLLYINHELKDNIRTRINNECDYHKIDPTKFCFNKSAIEAFTKNLDLQNEVMKKLGEMRKLTDLIDETKELRKIENQDEEIRRKLARNIREIIRIIEEKNRNETIEEEVIEELEQKKRR